MDQLQEIERLIKTLKNTHGKVFLVTVDEESFIIRAMSRPEYEEILLYHTEESLVEEKICQSAVLYPSDLNWDSTKAGMASILSRHVLEFSGFHNQNQVREWFSNSRALIASSFHEQAMIMVKTAFPEYNFEELESWSIEKLMKYMARAEWAHKEIYGRRWIDIHESENPEPEEDQQPPTLREIGERMREEGLDPMLEMGPIAKPPYIEFPIIAGTKFMENEEVFNLVREQVSRVSRR